MSVTKITFLILNYNSKFWLKKCLTSIQEFSNPPSKSDYKTVVVDNGSDDDSVKMVKKDFKWVELIELEKNLGYSAGNNIALREIDSEYVMLLNSDTEFTHSTKIEYLLNMMENQPQAAVITPQVILSNGKLDWACHRGEPTPWAALTYYLGLENFFPRFKIFGHYHQTYKDITVPHQVDACSGAAMLVRTKYMHQVGYLDERFFMYAEDLDWCKRFKEAGYEIWYNPQVNIIHHKYKSGIKTQSTLTSVQSQRYFYNTMLQYYDKHYHHEYPGVVRLVLRLFLFFKKGGM